MTIPTTTPRELLTPAEVAIAFKVNPKTVTRWAQAGHLTSIRTLGGHRRFYADEVHALLAPESIPTPTPAPEPETAPVETRPAHHYPYIIPTRGDMTGHTMSVERLARDCHTAYGAPSRDMSGRLAVVERVEGRFVSLPAIGEEFATGAEVEGLAATIAAVYEAEHVAVAR